MGTRLCATSRTLSVIGCNFVTLAVHRINMSMSVCSITATRRMRTAGSGLTTWTNFYVGCNYVPFYPEDWIHIAFPLR